MTHAITRTGSHSRAPLHSGGFLNVASAYAFLRYHGSAGLLDHRWTLSAGVARG